MKKIKEHNMRMRRLIVAATLIIGLALAGAAAAAPRQGFPPGFVHVADAVPDVILDIRYYSADNFVGARVDGYNAPTAILTVQAAAALKKAGDFARQQGYALKVFDAYRPQAAVDHFARWAKDPLDTKQKAAFYPGVDKSRLFSLGYIAHKSGHSRGSTVDLSLVRIQSGEEVDMGSPFDFFGEISHHGTRLISPEQTANRETLKKIMEASGFVPYAKEWWHYTLAREPYPKTYFTFPVE